MTRIGLVGLGRMGAALIERLTQQGFAVTGWDQRPEAVSAVAARGFTTAASARAVAEAGDVVISIVTEDNGVRRLFAGPGGFLEADVTGKLFIEMSTLQPATLRALAPAIEAKGARIIESPVLGTIPQVRDGKLVALAGGRPEHIEAARPVLETLTRKIVAMGPLGSGAAMKLAVNLGLASYVQAISESLALGHKQGLELKPMLEVLAEAPYASGWMASKVPVFLGEGANPSLDVKTLRKDVMSAVATGASTGVPMPLSAGVLAALSAAVAGGLGDADLGELPRFLRERMLQNFE